MGTTADKLNNVLTSKQSIEDGLNTLRNHPTFTGTPLSTWGNKIKDIPQGYLLNDEVSLSDLSLVHDGIKQLSSTTTYNATVESMCMTSKGLVVLVGNAQGTTLKKEIRIYNPDTLELLASTELARLGTSAAGKMVASEKYVYVMLNYQMMQMYDINNLSAPPVLYNSVALTNPAVPINPINPGLGNGTLNDMKFMDGKVWITVYSTGTIKSIALFDETTKTFSGPAASANINYIYDIHYNIDNGEVYFACNQAAKGN